MTMKPFDVRNRVRLRRKGGRERDEEDRESDVRRDGKRGMDRRDGERRRERGGGGRREVSAGRGAEHGQIEPCNTRIKSEDCEHQIPPFSC